MKKDFLSYCVLCYDTGTGKWWYRIIGFAIEAIFVAALFGIILLAGAIFC